MEYTIKNLRKLIDNKEISIYDLVKKIYKDLEEYEFVNGFVTKTKDLALKKAKELDKEKTSKNLLQGIPYIAKDLIITKDILTTACSDTLLDFIPPYNSKVISTLNDKKSILLGKSTTDELGMGGLGLNANNGIVCNPWNKEYISGGSSSGSAALVGTGIIPFALGTDTGDSIRKPASFCGVVGFKPTYGVISRVGIIPYSPSFDTVGYFTRNIEDCASLYQEILDYDENDFSMKHHKYDLKELSDDIKGIKVAYIQEIYEKLNPELKDKFDNLLSDLKKEGAIIKSISFNKEILSYLDTAYYVITCSESISSQSSLNGICFGQKEVGKNWEDSLIKTRTKNLGKLVQFRYLIGAYCSSSNNNNQSLNYAKRIRRIIFDDINKIFDKFDILIGPSVNCETKKIKSLNNKVVDFNGDIVDNFLLLANFSGIPSITLPLGFWKNINMPFGININSQRFNEKILFNFGLAIEKITKLKNLNPKDYFKKGEDNE